jgi:hypothetical protein
MDKKHSFCGHCHRYKPGGFDPSPMQRSCIRAIRGPEPVEALQALVQQAYRLAEYGAGTVHVLTRTLVTELMPLADATNITDEQRQALHGVIETAFGKWSLRDDVLAEPGTPNG